MRYTPRSSVTAVRTFSMRAGLDASTVTPGSAAPEVSRADPATDAWASASAGQKAVRATTNTPLRKVRIARASNRLRRPRRGQVRVRRKGIRERGNARFKMRNAKCKMQKSDATCTCEVRRTFPRTRRRNGLSQDDLQHLTDSRGNWLASARCRSRSGFVHFEFCILNFGFSSLSFTRARPGLTGVRIRTQISDDEFLVRRGAHAPRCVGHGNGRGSVRVRGAPGGRSDRARGGLHRRAGE